MNKSIRPVILVSKLLAVIVLAVALALSISWLVSTSQSKAGAATCDAVGGLCGNNQDCPLNADEQPVCQTDQTNPPDDTPPSDTKTTDPTPPASTPQVLGASTTNPDPSFQGK